MREAATILVVDDTPQNVLLLEALLTGRGYKVITASSGPRRSASSDRRRPTSSCSTWSCPG